MYRQTTSIFASRVLHWQMPYRCFLRRILPNNVHRLALSFQVSRRRRKPNYPIDRSISVTLLCKLTNSFPCFACFQWGTKWKSAGSSTRDSRSDQPWWGTTWPPCLLERRERIPINLPSKSNSIHMIKPRKRLRKDFRSRRRRKMLETPGVLAGQARGNLKASVIVRSLMRLECAKRF